MDLGASGSPRLETMANESWSLELLFAEVSAQGEPLALTNHQNKSGGCFLGILGHFSVLSLGLPWFFGAGKCKV